MTESKSQGMGTARLDAFSDGVIAIILTIMVLELKLPHRVTPEALIEQIPVLLSYLLSFFVVAIMWVNHHHLTHTVKRVNGRLLWINIHFLLWMSLIPFSTGLIGEGYAEPLAACIYGLNLALATASFSLLMREVTMQQIQTPALVAHRASRVRAEIFTFVMYLAGALLAFVSVYIAFAIYVALPLLFFIPEKQVGQTSDAAQP
ncbi:TMEM175 family protein [soil metagenome]